MRHKKNGKTSAKAHQKTIKIDLGVRKNDFSEKLIFAIPSMRKPRIRMPKNPNFDTEMNTKSFLESKPKKSQVLSPPKFKKLASTGPRIMLKSLKILFPTTSCPSYGSPGVPGWPRVAKMTSQGGPEYAKMTSQDEKYLPHYFEIT